MTKFLQRAVAFGSVLLTAGAVWAQDDSGTGGGGAAAAAGGVIGGLIGLAIALVCIVSFYKIFEKAGEPGWAAIVPIYNTFVMLKIAGKPAWWLVLMFIPCVGLVVAVIALVALAKNFGKGPLHGILFPLLAFSDAKYQPQR